MFHDVAGCTVIASFTIEHDGLGDCSQFTFSRDEVDNTGIKIYQETFISEVAADITVSLDSINVSDQNPVTDVLNIWYSDSRTDYKTVNIVYSGGNVIQIKNP